MTTFQIVMVSIFGGLIVLGVALIPLWILLYQTYLGNKTMKQLAAELGGHAYGGACCNVAQIAFKESSGGLFNISVNATRSNRSRRMLLLTGPWPDVQTRVTIFRETFWTRARKFLGMQDLKVGVKRFDDTFVLQSVSHPALMDILNTSAQDLLMNLSATDHGSSLNVSIGGGQIRMTIETKASDFRLLKRQARALLDLRQFMLLTSGGGDTAVVEMGTLKSVDRDGVCMICGESINAHRVECGRCRTPHHKDCWDYFGSCSVYGCGETAYARKPR